MKKVSEDVSQPETAFLLGEWKETEMMVVYFFFLLLMHQELEDTLVLLLNRLVEVHTDHQW